MKFRLVMFLVLSALKVSATDLSDIETFLGQKSFDEVQMSPDGSRLAFILRENDFKNDREVFSIWKIDLGSGGRAGTTVRLIEAGSVSSLKWSPDGKLLSFLAVPGADSGAQLQTMSPEPDARPRALTREDHFPNGIDFYDWLPDGSGFVVAAGDPPAEKTSPSPDGDVARLPAPGDTSSLSKVALADGRVDRLFGAPFDEVEGLAVSPDGKWVGVIGSASSETIASNEAALIPLAPGAAVRRTRNLVLEDHIFWAGDHLFVSGMGDERAGRFTVTEPRLYRAEPGRNASELVLTRVAPGFEGSLSEVVPLADGSLLTDETISTQMRISAVNPSDGVIRKIRDQHGWVANLSASRDGKRIAFVAGDPRRFAEIHVANGLAGVASAVAVTGFNARLSQAPLPEIETVDWTSSDGVRVEGVVDWPPGRKGEKGLPLIVDLHGGPFGVGRIESLDLYGAYMSYPALLAARGYVVLNVNYRGSGGRGDEFTRGIQDRFCTAPSDDVVRGVQNLVSRGWADPKRVGAIGYSGGGGLTKCLVGRTDVFRAIATGAGVWDGISLFGTSRGSFWAEVFFDGKAPWDDFEHWWKESPIGGMASAKTPTLIVAGQKDGEAPTQAKEMYQDLLRRGTPAELLIFPGETHIFAKPSHKKTKIRSELAWFDRYLSR